MHGLIIAATALEIQPLQSFLKKQKDWKTVITGMGAAVTAYALTKACLAEKPSFVLQVGVAGSLDKSLALADVVAVSTDCFGDMGVVEHRQRKTLFDMQWLQPDQRPYKKGKLVQPDKKLLKRTGLPLVQGVTVNEITTRKADADFYKQVLGAQVETMEGAALHYVCLQERIPFLQVRSISNYVGERDKTKWKMKEALAHLSDMVKDLVLKLV